MFRRQSRYNPRDWYWIVAGSATDVFSSASGDFVPVADATYQAWLAGDRTPTRIASEAELGEELARHDITPVAAAVLDGFKGKLAENIPLRVLFQILLNHENRIRTLAGQPSVTPAQFRNAIKSLL